VSSDGEAVNVLYHHENVVQAAVDGGVSHIVALSGLDVDLSCGRAVVPATAGSPLCPVWTSPIASPLLP